MFRRKDKSMSVENPRKLGEFQDEVEKKWNEIDPLEEQFCGKSMEWEGDDGLFYKLEASRDPI